VCFAQVYGGCKVHLMCVRLMQSRMELFSTAAKLFVWHLRQRNVKSVNHYKYHYKYLFWKSSQMTKTFRDNCDINIVQQTSRKPLVPDAQMQLRMYFFVPFVLPCMHHIMLSFQKVMHAKIAGGLQFWMQSSIQPALERVLVLIRFNVTFLHLKHQYENTSTCFSRGAESLKT